MHNNHGPNSMPANIPQAQQQPPNLKKIDTNCVGPQQQSQRYKPLNSVPNQPMPPAMATVMPSSSHSGPKSLIQMATKKENVHNMERIDVNHGCVYDTNHPVNVIAATNATSKTKTPMCLINELVRANQVCFYWVSFCIRIKFS